IGGDGAAFNAVELVERRYVSIVFTPAVKDRGWPQATMQFHMFETNQASHNRLRDLVVQILWVAPQLDVSLNLKEASSAIRESILACIDGVFAQVVPTKWASRANSARQFRTFQDIRAVLAGSLGSAIYSEELALQVGISVRAMHDAVLRHRGMSLHR